MRKARLFKRLIAWTMAVVLLLAVSVSASAEYSYSYYLGDQGTKTETTDRAVFTVKEVLDGRLVEGGFNQISDIQVVGEKIYLLDAGNSRVVVLNADYSFERTIIPTEKDGKAIQLNAPEGLFINSDGSLYIADTENQRILLCDAAGVCREVLTAPEAGILPDNFTFAPVDILVNSDRYVYILLRGSYYGALLYNPAGEFIGFFGANSVSVTILEGIAKLFTDLFQTNEKLAVSEQSLPYQINDFSIDENGYIYTVSSDDEKLSGQIRKLNAGGGNVLKYKSGYDYVSSDEYNFAEDQVYTDLSGVEVDQHFSGIDVENGIIYALDDIYGKIYVYDTKCAPVTVFGGGVGQGTQQGLFLKATAIAVCGNDVLVCDQQKNTVTVFTRTEYGDALLRAIAAEAKDDYSGAKPLWQTVLKYNKANQLANRGLAKVYIEEKNYKKALYYARMGNDQETYSVAFQILEGRYLNANMWWILLVAVLLIALGITLKIVFKKRGIQVIRHEKVRVALQTATHPFESFRLIKEKDAGSVGIAAVIMVLFYVVLVSTDLWSGFMYRLPDPKYNALFTLLGSVGVLLLWVIVQFAVTALFTGNGTLKQIFVVSCYSLTPVIAYKLIYLCCTYVLVPSGNSLVTLLGTVAVLYSGFLMIVGMIRIHEYGFAKVVGVSLLTIVGMMIVVFILFMLLTLGQGCFNFIMNIFSEVAFR